MDDEFFEHAFYYDDRYWTFSELYEMYKKLPEENKKLFKDSLAHFTLGEILRKCLFDKRYIAIIEDLAQREASKISLYGCDCGRLLLGYERRYNAKLRELLNLTGQLSSLEDNRITNFTNGELFLNNIVNSTLNFYEKDELNDFSLIKYQLLSEEECLAIANNFVRSISNEEMVLYNDAKVLKKADN